MTEPTDQELRAYADGFSFTDPETPLERRRRLAVRYLAASAGHDQLARQEVIEAAATVALRPTERSGDEMILTVDLLRLGDVVYAHYEIPKAEGGHLVGAWVEVLDEPEQASDSTWRFIGQPVGADQRRMVEVSGDSPLVLRCRDDRARPERPGLDATIEEWRTYATRLDSYASHQASEAATCRAALGRARTRDEAVAKLGPLINQLYEAAEEAGL